MPKRSQQHSGSIGVETVSRHEAGTDLLSFVSHNTDCSKRQAKALLDRKQVQVNGKQVWMAKHKLREGDKVTLPRPRKAKGDALPAEVPIIYQDDELIIINKPAGLVSENHAESAEAILRGQLGAPKLRALHRLDRGTSGLLMLNRNQRHRDVWIDLFRNPGMTKEYLAVVRGHLPKGGLTVDKILDHRASTTRFDPISGSKGYLLVRCTIETGRKHQIRRHLLTQGCQIPGDRTYTLPGQPPQDELLLPWPLLHAARLTFRHPRTEKQVTFRCDPPDTFVAFQKKRGL